MHKIRVRGIRLYGFHGCLDEEEKIGSEYRVDICVWADLTKAATSDRLSTTVDYVLLNRIATEEIAKRAKLIETVAHRISRRILSQSPLVEKTEVIVTKCFPPINGDVEEVQVVWVEQRKRPQ